MEEIIYREVIADDIDSLRALYNCSFPIKYDDSFYNEVRRKSRRGNKVYTFVATVKRPEGQHLVGAITFEISSLHDRDHDRNLETFVTPGDLKRNRTACYIMTIATHSNFKRKGIATKLLLMCQTTVRKAGDCVMTYLHVIHWNDSAMSLYSKQGFSEFTFLPKFYHFDAKRHDAYLFGKRNILDTPKTVELVAPPVKGGVYRLANKTKEGGSVRRMLKSIMAFKL